MATNTYNADSSEVSLTSGDAVKDGTTYRVTGATAPELLIDATNPVGHAFDFSTFEESFSVVNFKMTIDTEQAGSASDTFILPTSGVGYDSTINWGDGNETVLSGIPGNTSHTYGSAGIYTISIRENSVGGFPKFAFNNSGDKSKVTAVTQWGPIQWDTWQDMFQGCNNLISVADDDIPNISNVISPLEFMRSCTGVPSLNGVGWDVSGWSNWSSAFRSMDSLTSFDMTGWVTTALRNLNFTFYFSSLLDPDISHFDITNLVDAPGCMEGSGFSQTNYDKMLIAWDAQGTSGVTFHAGTAKYGAGAPATAKAAMEGRGWSFTDGGAA